MIALTSPYLWYSTRATGLVTLLLFTLVVSLGTLVANRVGGKFVGRFEIAELHRSISIVAMVFLAIHIITTVLDSYVSTGFLSVVVPFASPYKRTPVALGAIAFDLMMAVWISSVVKARVANQTWRFIHWFSWIGYGAAIVHALLIGTDAKGGIGYLVVIASASVVVGGAVWRFLARPTRAAGRTALSPIGVEVAREPARRTNNRRLGEPASARERPDSRELLVRPGPEADASARVNDPDANRPFPRSPERPTKKRSRR